MKQGRQSIEQRMLLATFSHRDNDRPARYVNVSEEDKERGRARRKVDLIHDINELGEELMEVWE